VILHELLTGHLPADDPRPASVISRCDHRFDAIIRRATDPLPEKRYSSAHDIERELRGITAMAGPRLRRTPVRTAPRGIRHRITKKTTGNPGITFLLIAGIAAAVGYFIVSTKNQSPVEPMPPPSAPGISKSNEPGNQSAGNTHEPKPPPEIKSVVPDPKPESRENQTSVTRPYADKKPDAVLPKFDVPGFLERARKIMLAKAAPAIAARDKSLKENLSRFEWDAKQAIRKIDYRGARDDAEKALEHFIKDCESNQHTIPETLPSDLHKVSILKDIHQERLEIQETIALDLTRSLSPFSATYILGLEKQIERLKSENDPAAIQALKEEITNTRDDDSHFVELMLDIKNDEDR